MINAFCGVFLLSVVASTAWQFNGLFQVSDEAANCTRCTTDNPRTATCGCPASSSATFLRALTDCAGANTLSGTDIGLCYLNDRTYTDGSYGGVFQLDDAVVGSLGCRSPNRVTGACNCPFLFREIVTRAMVDTPEERGRVLGSSVVFCVNDTATPHIATSSSFGGVFQQLDSGVCSVLNPFTKNCSCPANASLMNRFRAISDGPVGSYITVCAPPNAPPPVPPSDAGNTYFLYVNTSGNDASNGTSPFMPLRTIAQALDTVALSGACRSGRNVTVRVAAGVYPQPVTLVWGASSCGSRPDGTFVTVEAYPVGARVAVSGGIDVSSLFTKIPQHDSVVQWFHASLSNVIPQELLWQMWRKEGADKEEYARISLVAQPTEAYESLLSTTPPIAFQLSSSAQAPPYPADLSSSFVVMYHSWTSTTNTLANYDPLTKVVTVGGSAPDNVYNTASGNRFRFVNLPPSFLTAGNETRPTQPWTYYMNKTTKEVFLATPAGTTSLPAIIAPLLRTVVSIQGPACYNVVLSGITVAHTDSFLEEQCLSTGCSGQSATFLAGAGLELQDQIGQALLQNITVAHVGGYALWVHGATNSITVNRAVVHDLGAGGVRVGEAISGTIADRSLLASNVQLVNSIIFDGGYIVEAGAGVLLQQAASCTIAHNDIHDLFYTGVSIGWNWGYAPTSNNNIVVQYNLMYNLGRGVLSDMGCIYNLGTSPGTLMDHNVCHDLQSFGYGGWGLYSDEGTSLVSWTNNIVYRTKSAPYHQHYGMNNLVKNNVFAFPQVTLGESVGASNGDFAAVRSSPAYSGPEHETSFTLSTNVILLRNTSAALFYSTIEDAFINVTANNNVYYNTAVATASLQFPCFRGAAPLRCPLAEWQGLGEDLLSLAQDPLFLDADGYNFSALSVISPALRLGFAPIDTRNVGPALQVK
ncbi:Hypothetical protein, putative [Bodo saltans]|uniref:Right handed beta helix domain-containing protein n=1 Tax=Bodo saltans TaxID=75058 RepID=A0A0S4KJK9_BODSA|nr:Hypothetical protein, putative [Bodo saltans]|eukprot:CUI14646.1 Hypothetical protein, putative [Bodo saltans]